MAENKRPPGSTTTLNHNNDADMNNWNYDNGDHYNNKATSRKHEGEEVKKLEKRIDFTNLASRKSRANRGSPMPMAIRPRNVLEEVDGRAERLSHVVDTQRMQLISPPPEETLRRNPRSSGQFTPSFSTNVSGPARGSSAATTKRKRTQQTSTPMATDATTDPTINNHAEQHLQGTEATPNPKPRKQGRHARLPSIDSPSKASASPPSQNDLNATPSRRKKVVVQSPHAKNPDADWIPPAPVFSILNTTSRRSVLGARSSRRSATPIPPYEPPKDVFTPPREVYLSPVVKTASRTSKRKSPSTTKSNNVTKLRVVTTQIKQEIPDNIDLTAPMPPPSPSDDPILLSGPPEPPIESSPLSHRAPRRSVSIQAQIDDLPPSSPEPPLDSEDVHAVNAFDFGQIGDLSTDLEGDSMMQLDSRDADVAPVRLFDFDDFPSGSGGWTDSDDDMEQPTNKSAEEAVEEGEGEYTGRWKMMKVRTKQDPPSSATRGRMEEWGRPISPFPYPKIKKLDLVGEEIEEEENTVGEEKIIEEGDTREDKEVRRMSVEPEQLSTLQAPEEEDEEEEREVREMSMELNSDEENTDLSNQQIDLSSSFKLLAHDSALRIHDSRPILPDNHKPNTLPFPSLELPKSLSSAGDIPGLTPITDEDERIQGVSVEPSEDVNGCNDENQDDDDESDESDSYLADTSLVKITSADPRAAARAVAILKQYDYDCYTKPNSKRRQSDAKQRRSSHSGIQDLAKEMRRRDVITSGISKSSRKPRTTLAMGVIGDQVFIPGTPVMTLPQLLQEAEAEVERKNETSPGPRWASSKALEAVGQRDPFRTPVIYRTQQMQKFLTEESDIFVSPSANQERVWTKEEWKLLDACFTDQRLDVGASMEGAKEDTLAPVHMVAIEDVVDRFVAFIGGQDVAQSYGGAWSRDNLLERARALQRKQYNGIVAPPTTPRSPALSLSSGKSTQISRALNEIRRIPTMEIPDFTPLGRRAGPPRRSRPILPAPASHNAPFAHLPPEEIKNSASNRVPPTLLAPRYSHLLEEAISINSESNQQHGTRHTPDMGETAFASEYSNTSFDNDDHSQYDAPHDKVDSINLDDSVSKNPDSNQDSPTSSLGKRVKGFLFSYLPAMSSKHPTTSRKALTTRQPGLPLPPSNILDKPRGPVATPIRPPLPKPKVPKELVRLHPAPPLQPSVLPRTKTPRRLVELHHLPPPQEKPVVTTSLSRPRRSSGSSVKDLVKGFEEMQNNEEKAKQVSRVRTCSGDLGRKHAQDIRPRWRL